MSKICQNKAKQNMKHIKTQKERNNQINITIDRALSANNQKQFMKRKMLTMGESYTPWHSVKCHQNSSHLDHCTTAAVREVPPVDLH